MTAKDSGMGSNLDATQKTRGLDQKSKSQTNAEYFQALERWLNDIRTYSYSCCFLSGLPYVMENQQVSSYSSTETQTTNLGPPAPPLNQNFGMFMFQRPQQQQIHQDQGVEYKIPPLWKRFAAELVDFVLLFLLKLAITFIAVDFFGLGDNEIYIADTPQKKHSEMDYKLTIEITSRILFVEIIHRLIICVYEGIFLRKGSQNQVGGATPGKTLMGIKVVLCHSVQQIGNDPNAVKVFPASNLGLGWSFARAFLKNLVVALFFPVFFPLLFNKFHRTGYDVLCNSIVVEDRLE